MRKELSTTGSRWIAYDAARVRILLDYRPALRERTGVGEYVHELAIGASRSSRPVSR